MKKIFNHIPFPLKFRRIVFMFGLSLFTISLSAQTGEEEKTESTQSDPIMLEEEAVTEKETLRMTFESFTVNNEVRLQARVRSKVETKWTNTTGIEVSFYRNEVSPEGLMGKDTSNELGETYWQPVSKMQQDTFTVETYYAVVQSHPDFEDVEETITIRSSVMTMELEEVDSVRLVKVFIGYPDETGEIVPLPETECMVYVQRLFGLLLVAEAETTDEEGNIAVAFPNDIKGDESGNVIIVARVVEHELLGNVEVSKEIAWGIPVKTDTFYLQRELWSARANSPILLIIVVNVLILGIWGTIGFIFLEIFRINKLGRTNR